MWSIAPSSRATQALIDFWRTADARGTLVHDFTDAEWSTRFLGDLYQDLSEEARKSYALVQTPEFVEEFILSYTLDPAIKEFGLEPEPPYGHPELPHRLRVIDPVCGSGSFVLSAFHRLLRAWEAVRPGADRLELVARALDSVHGVDKNPFAVTITRFRLLVAAMKAADVACLDQESAFPRLNIAVGDSLLHGMGAPPLDLADFRYTTEDVDDFRRAPVALLSAGTYQVVVGNPPYITVKDKSENQNYRAYRSSSATYSLTVPFMERMFQLASLGRLSRLPTSTPIFPWC
jgi:predicted helicase